MPHENSGGTPPWAALMAIVIAIGGAAFYFSSLASPRPPAPSSLDLRSLGLQDADARLWQDPFHAAVDRRERLASNRSTRQDPGFFGGIRIGAFGIPGPTTRASENPHDLSALLHSCPVAEGKKVLVLTVLASASSYAETTEQRLRSRVAVLEGLAVSGYEPINGEHIGYVEMPWCWRKFNPGTGDPGDQEPEAVEPLLIPYEWSSRALFRMVGSRTKSVPAPYDAVLLLWVDEEAVGDVPLRRLAALKESVQKQTSNDWTFKIIGPGTSSTLRAMVDEAAASVPEHVKATLSTAQAFVATATAGDAVLLHGVTEERESAVSFIARRLATGHGAGLQIQRATLTDDELTQALVEELELRRINVKGSAIRPAMNDIAIVAEWDTFYGRALPFSFAAAASTDANVEELLKTSKPFPSWIHPFVYLRGIDGQVPNRGAAEAVSHWPSLDQSDKRRGTPKTESPSEAPEGLNQTDYLRRLADQLGELDLNLRRQGKPGLAAVGVLGTDVYDTLLVMRALRDRLPDVTFFTTQMDAEYSMANEWPAAHNLLIAAPFGLRLHSYYQHNIPPFRDCNQTATFWATQCAAGPGSPSVAAKPNSADTVSLGKPRRYEIGRDGPLDISVDDDVESLDPFGKNTEQFAPDSGTGGEQLKAPKTRTVHPPRYDMGRRPFRAWPWIGGLVAIMILLALPLLAHRPPNFLAQVYGAANQLKTDRRAMGRRFSHFARVVAVNTPLFTCLAVLAIAMVLFLLIPADPVKGPPLSFFNRVNAWPTEAIRLLAALMSLHWIVKSVVEAWNNNDEIEDAFRLKPLPPRSEPLPTTLAKQQLAPLSLRPTWRIGRWRVFGDANGKEVSEPKTVEAKRGTFVYAQNLWWEYLRRGDWRFRLLRSLAMTLAFWLLAFCIYSFFGAPVDPVRGPVLGVLNAVCLWSSVFCFLLLTFFVLDSTLINIQFIQHLAKTDTTYPEGAFEQFHRFGVEQGDLTEYADVRLIAARTEVVGDVIYYPFAVFFLIVVARTTLFADWKWTAPLFVVQLLTLTLAIIGAISLRSIAERARREALARISKRIIMHTAAGRTDKRSAVKGIRDLVTSERQGAFSILSRHPIVAAILLPSGSIGFWALLEFLAKSAAGG